MALITYGFWFYEELRDKIGTSPGKHRGDESDSYIDLDTPTGSYMVKTSSLRMELFRQSPKCVSCDRVGSLWMLQAHRPKEPPHLNLYYVGEPIQEWKKLSQDGLVMMTKDHIIPKSKGGPTTLKNLQTMCSICNGKKGNTLLHEAQINGISAWSDPIDHRGEMECLCGLPHFH